MSTFYYRSPQGPHDQATDAMDVGQPGANPYRGWDGARSDPELPALSVLDLDRLVQLRLQEERRRMRAETQGACAEAWDQGRQFGAGEGLRRAAVQIRDVINGRLIHISRRLGSRGAVQKRRIDDERKFIDGEHEQLERAVQALLAIGSETSS